MNLAGRRLDFPVTKSTWLLWSYDSILVMGATEKRVGVEQVGGWG
jgi:hypothetical protein